MPDSEREFLPPSDGEDRHAILGKYMDAWNYLETDIRGLLWILARTESIVADLIVFSGIDTRALRETVLGLAKIRLSTADYNVVVGFCNRAMQAAKNRNRIVHGRWQRATNIFTAKDGSTKSGFTRWYRVYPTTDPDADRKIFVTPDEKYIKENAFDCVRVGQETEITFALAREINAFVGNQMGPLHERGLLKVNLSPEPAQNPANPSPPTTEGKKPSDQSSPA